MAGEFSVLRWSCVNCHADGERYPSNFNSAAVHSRHTDTQTSGDCDSCHNMGHASSDTGMGGCYNECHKGGLTCKECHNDVQNSMDTANTSLLSEKFGKDVHLNKKSCTDCHGGLTSINPSPSCTTCHPLTGSNLTTVPGSIETKSHSNKKTVACGLCHNNEHDIKSLTMDIAQCKTCHAGITHNNMAQCTVCHGSDPHNVSAGGGADCVSCHNISDGFTSPDKRINVSSIKEGVHKNLNNGTDNSTLLTDPIDKACWACHGDGGEPSNGHPDNFRVPYSCDNCHGQSSNLSYTNTSLISNLTTRKVFNHVPSPDNTQDASSIKNNSSADCKGCHDKSKVKYSDSGLSIEANVSHYASRTNLVSPTIDCSLCHKNPINASIYWANVTRHPAKTQERAFCENCHFTDLLSADFHNNAPIKIKRVHVDFRWEENLCSTPCHGGPAKKICEDCHLPDGSGPYMDGTWKDLTNMTPRVFAHTNFSPTIKVPDQSNVIAPSQGATTFSSCYAFNTTTLSGTCHAISIQSKNAGGGYFTLNNYTTAYDNGSAYHETITVDRMPKTTNCVFCHNQTNATVRFAWGNGTQITGGTHNWYTGNDNSKCWNCHVSTGKAPVDFHSDSMRGGGGEECIGCHRVDQGNYSAINITTFGKHSNVNRTDGINTLTNSDCLTCHYDFNYTMMMETGFRTPTMTCTDCHIAGNFSAPIIQNHKPPKVPVSSGGKISTTVYCTICHNNSINKYIYSVNASVSHYGINESPVKTVNQTSKTKFGFMTQGDAQQYNKECNNCHNPSNSSYGNATLITVSHIGRGTCNECHINGSASDLHNGSLGMPVTFSCKACHTTYASTYGAPDLTGTSMANYISCGAANCHYNETDSLNSPAMHNVDRTFAGTPGSTDTVYLNNYGSLTVTKGAIVTITSRVNDTLKFGGASRIGGAEYYIDIDPGLGKGIPMDAVDGSYDALQATWEPVKSTIDTGILSKGNHTIYVRGMDIGKQWSAPQNATLIVQVFGYINGTVTNGTAATVSDVYVSTTGVNYTTGSDGNYSLRVLVGNYTVNASKQPKHYDNTSINVIVTQNNTTILPLVLREKPTGTINGIVTIV